MFFNVRMSALWLKRTPIDSEKLHTQWKLAHVTPVHKGRDKMTANNYHLISLTSNLCKLIEHIVLHYMSQKLYDFLHIWQHGFRRSMSCKTQLCATFHELARIVEATHAVVLQKSLRQSATCSADAKTETNTWHAPAAGKLDEQNAKSGHQRGIFFRTGCILRCPTELSHGSHTVSSLY